jgi:hypothetical protein
MSEDGFYSATLDSSIGRIMIFIVPKSCQISLRNVVIDAFKQECKFVSFVNFEKENETAEERIKSVYENNEGLILLNIQDGDNIEEVEQEEGETQETTEDAKVEETTEPVETVEKPIETVPVLETVPEKVPIVPTENKNQKRKNKHKPPQNKTHQN